MTYKLLAPPYSGIYKIISQKEVIYVPDDLDNRDWREYQEWLAAGNEPEPADD